eukprot:CAMPEP_0172178878 /NCGR_PEP_ID=MMETSP1050-20130122/16291_1 /TAXON_ID=233186 /ORGANISM="Cryptomonas curvata, Strain CCAP979/52" /LENGTH=106 /DNA_ID=CAMNT_0012851667 /DNA_START=196 /DNA_END=516 /DNA_ORIENTATION=-
MTELDFGDQALPMGRRCKSTNDLEGAYIEYAGPLASSTCDMLNFEEEFHTIEDDDLDSTFFDATESRMATRPSFADNCRSKYNFQTGLILCNEELQQNRKQDVILL